MVYHIAHYRKANSDWFINGGKLIVTESEYIIKGLFKEVARFSIDNAVISRVPNIMFYKGVNISNDSYSYDLYLFPKTADKLFYEIS